MGSTCLVCEHPQRKEMEKDYVTNRLNLTNISKKYGVSYWSIRSHMQAHLPEQLIEVARNQELQSSGELLTELQGLVQSAQNQLDRAEKKGHSRVALESIRTLKDLYQLLLQIQVKLIELEQQKTEQQRFDPENEEQIAELHSRLNTPELDMLFRLQMKMIGDTSEVIIIPDNKVDTPVNWSKQGNISTLTRNTGKTRINEVEAGDNDNPETGDNPIYRYGRKDREYAREFRRKMDGGDTHISSLYSRDE